ncbi:hypothetical protein NPIL_674741, partial [Nephila pilipes]
MLLVRTFAGQQHDDGNHEVYSNSIIQRMRINQKFFMLLMPADISGLQEDHAGWDVLGSAANE